ncbi:hypothetical protein ABENE_07575 [Asticcacaulis benevestitus DSM 16100 = ATCC BAA-896]|uniref:Peptide N-acetyl-beta-D-glucosaminyl asparaginase amidase A N-terminal domain-containing protein n=2 Tax=Asticcacaulis TaxID=76890 RepID=V4PWD9_9CAUL|nr:hypothetical protein ABENE_07575 [Asticcacaulis benevestitus DSM 16100 = ATCC BAA-896]
MWLMRLTPLLAALAASAHAETIAAPPPAPIGTNTVASAELYVARPGTTPCVVDLLAKHEFIGEQPVAMTYAPPAACPGPWAKVVIETDFNVTRGRQFDRTAIINLGGVNLYLGTTMEPRRDIAPVWHAERDITDYSSLLTTPQSGEFLLANYVDDTYTGHLFGAARLLFYPADAQNPAPATAQLVVPLSDRQASLTNAAPALTKTLTLPRNVERLYLDVMAEPQGDDEFWYGCVSDRFITKDANLCGGGSLRETEVLIDGTPAGVAPIYPWIYTGGINPYLWFPSPGVQTLNFEPYRVDLTPFAASLNDGLPHTIALQVEGARRYVYAMGTLMAWLDEGVSVVTGGLTRNTLKAPEINVDDARMSAKGSDLNGQMTTTLPRDYVIEGYVVTSHGRVTTRLHQTSRLSNHQAYETSLTQAIWRVRQSTDLATTLTTTDAAGVQTRMVEESFPLTIDYHDTFHKDYGLQDIDLYQGLKRTIRETGIDGRVRIRNEDLSTAPKLHALLDPKTHRTKATTGTSVHKVSVTDSDGACYDRTLTSRNNVVVTVSDGCTTKP